MPAEWLANIDDEQDLIHTEALLKNWKHPFRLSANGARRNY